MRIGTARKNVSHVSKTDYWLIASGRSNFDWCWISCTTNSGTTNRHKSVQKNFLSSPWSQYMLELTGNTFWLFLNLLSRDFHGKIFSPPRRCRRHRDAGEKLIFRIYLERPLIVGKLGLNVIVQLKNYHNWSIFRRVMTVWSYSIVYDIWRHKLAPHTKSNFDLSSSSYTMRLHVPKITSISFLT